MPFTGACRRKRRPMILTCPEGWRSGEGVKTPAAQPDPGRARQDLDVPASLAAVARAVSQRFAAVLDRVDVPLTLVQLRALYALLDESAGVPLRRWAQKLGMSDPSASRLGQRLERDGLIDRRAGAGRELSLIITQRGRDAVAAIEQAQSQELYRLTLPLAVNDRRRLLTLIGRLVAQGTTHQQGEP